MKLFAYFRKYSQLLLHEIMKFTPFISQTRRLKYLCLAHVILKIIIKPHTFVIFYPQFLNRNY